MEVRDQYGNPLPNAQVTFSITTGDGLLSGKFSTENATTNDLGRTQLILTLGPHPGKNTVGVYFAGREFVTFDAMGVGTPVAIMDGDFQKWHLPEGAIVRFGKGGLSQAAGGNRVFS